MQGVEHLPRVPSGRSSHPRHKETPLTAESFINGILADLGEEQDAHEGRWAYDRLTPCAEGDGYWFTANHDDGRFLQVWIEHRSHDACGYSHVSLER